MNKSAKFNVGERVIHKQHGYRAVIIDADPYFQASGRYNPQAMKREFATRNPWYRLLVDESSQITYVEECFLKPDPSSLKINNPNLETYLHESHGKYHSNRIQH
ncbi:heat shock protein HspQ [Legionella jordanis]|uniref:Heat shock protein HspQ n=1 Tax=Legionella jordanis TaxID=456 RepID=A0A0W0VDP5_9GAMM|nr:heat shock protein HspQ [Legionella jordanis]KTD17974.1 putative DNA-binding protein hemimethylated [Legionella jordanis]RMX02335.1 heat shock protein HspQ [Legionella jordanis]RMX15785.1 heat shock protein HspQ [Legionella jordanis]VEH13934.1 putative DNA-binding protein hemimethylated [Legionella jordanis]HAT8714313.1 heat shock protein HspQ [Legionella jordanis]